MSEPLAPLQVIPLGVGDFFSRRENTTTLLVIGGHTRMLIDCPDPPRKVLSEATAKAGMPLDLLDIDDILLTHLHGDHCNGLEGFGFFRKMHPDSPGRPRVYALPENLLDLWERRLRGSMGRSYMPHKGIDTTSALEDYFDPRPIEPGKPFRVGDLEIVARRTRHPVPCVGCKIRYGGRVFAYSCDTDFELAHIDFLAEGDLIFHETNEGIHANYDDLASLPERLRARMRLVHLADEFDRAALSIEPAESGRVYLV
ncbi:MAG: ribonuclease Z [candidate division BRC1 bacterium ADurb.BinA364]|nr:MAG: ribonuclease Z [candidate division BRC1 bacterium ADurb.BinA364]